MGCSNREARVSAGGCPAPGTLTSGAGPPARGGRRPTQSQERVGMSSRGARRRAPARRSGRRRAQVRRRRAAALACLSLLLIAVVLLATSAGGSRQLNTGPAVKKVARTGSGDRRPPKPKPDLTTEEDRAIDRLLARQPFISQGGSERREIALTFDDGPGPARHSCWTCCSACTFPPRSSRFASCSSGSTIPRPASCTWAT